MNILKGERKLRLGDTAMKRLLSLIVLALPSMASAESLNLVCTGTGAWPEIQQGFGTARTSDGRGAYGSGMSSHTARDSQQFRVQVSGSEGRIKVPRVMVPRVNSGGGADGWWPLRDVRVSEDQITASFSLNFLNKPKVVIDRMSGEIDVKGSVQFSFNGSCEAAPVETERRF